MKTNKTITILALASLVTTGVASAQDQGGEGRPGMMRGMMGERKEFREERRADIEEMKGEMKKVGEQFREEMKARKEYMMGSTTGTATPTPWKNLRENMKDVRKDFRDDRKEDRKEWRDEHGMPAPRPLNATATAAIAAKLGITAESLQAQLASGTKLKELVKDKISPEEMKQILPPKVATFTRAMEGRGFFANIRSTIFGARKEIIEQKMDEFGEVTMTPTGEQPAVPFWKKFFGF
jgi:cytochrome c556